MPEAKINETCIIGLPTCGYAFSSTRMAFIAAPSDESTQLELNILQSLLEEKGYEAFVALQRVDPAKLAFCTKICSKIISAQFCMVMLNSSAHKDHPTVLMPNPNVHLEYGLMLAFKKYVIPFQREGDALAFNIRPLDTVVYSSSTFKDKAERAIDDAILAAATTSRPTRPMIANESIQKYLIVRNLRFTDVSTEEGGALYRLGSPLGFFLLDGQDVVYFGLFDQESAKELVFRIKLLLQNLHNAKRNFDEFTSRLLTPEQREHYLQIWKRIRVEALVSKDVDIARIGERIRQLSQTLTTVPWRLVTQEDIEATIKMEYDSIGEM